MSDPASYSAAEKAKGGGGCSGLAELYLLTPTAQKGFPYEVGHFSVISPALSDVWLQVLTSQKVYLIKKIMDSSLSKAFDCL